MSFKKVRLAPSLTSPVIKLINLLSPLVTSFPWLEQHISFSVCLRVLSLCLSPRSLSLASHSPLIFFSLTALSAFFLLFVSYLGLRTIPLVFRYKSSLCLYWAGLTASHLTHSCPSQWIVCPLLTQRHIAKRWIYVVYVRETSSEYQLSCKLFKSRCTPVTCTRKHSHHRIALPLSLANQSSRRFCCLSQQSLPGVYDSKSPTEQEATSKNGLATRRSTQ